MFDFSAVLDGPEQQPEPHREGWQEKKDLPFDRCLKDVHRLSNVALFLACR